MPLFLKKIKIFFWPLFIIGASSILVGLLVYLNGTDLIPLAYHLDKLNIEGTFIYTFIIEYGDHIQVKTIDNLVFTKEIDVIFSTFLGASLFDVPSSWAHLVIDPQAIIRIYYGSSFEIANLLMIPKNASLTNLIEKIIVDDGFFIEYPAFTEPLTIKNYLTQIYGIKFDT